MTPYMLIFRDTTPEAYEELTLEETRGQLERWNGWIDDLVRRGHMQGGHPLFDEGRVVAAGKATKTLDGPFVESKELIGGFFLITAADLDQATAIGEECPLLEFGMVVEVRPVAPVCHLARTLGWETMRGPSARPA